MPLSDIARAVEDRFHRDTVPVLKRQGWRPRVIPYDGYGTSAPAQPGHGEAAGLGGADGKSVGQGAEQGSLGGGVLGTHHHAGQDPGHGSGPGGLSGLGGTGGGPAGG